MLKHKIKSDAIKPASSAIDSFLNPLNQHKDELSALYTFFSEKYEEMSEDDPLGIATDTVDELSDEPISEAITTYAGILKREEKLHSESDGIKYAFIHAKECLEQELSLHKKAIEGVMRDFKDEEEHEKEKIVLCSLTSGRHLSRLSFMLINNIKTEIAKCDSFTVSKILDVKSQSIASVRDVIEQRKIFQKFVKRIKALLLKLKYYLCKMLRDKKIVEHSNGSTIKMMQNLRIPMPASDIVDESSPPRVSSAPIEIPRKAAPSRDLISTGWSHSLSKQRSFSQLNLMERIDFSDTSSDFETSSRKSTMPQLGCSPYSSASSGKPRSSSLLGSFKQIFFHPKKQKNNPGSTSSSEEDLNQGKKEAHRASR